MVELAYSNIYQSTFQMGPFEAPYGLKCHSPVCWSEVGQAKLLSAELVQLTIENVRLIRERMKIAQSQ